jgi:hypothetical protein
MPAQEPSLKFEDLLETVQESERGRWFIAEFEARLRKTETASIFAAINKLEGVIAGQNQGGMDAVLVARARAAIASARREIANLDGSKQQLSDEAASSPSWQTSPAPPFRSMTPARRWSTAGVSRALLLVDQLDQDLAATPACSDNPVPISPPTLMSLSSRRLAAPAVRWSAPPQVKPMVQTWNAAPGCSSARPATAPISRSCRPCPSPRPRRRRATCAGPDTGAATAEVPALVPPAPRKQSRVVIIRRKPEELLDVPLVDDDTGATAA